LRKQNRQKRREDRIKTAAETLLELSGSWKDDREILPKAMRKTYCVGPASITKRSSLSREDHSYPISSLNVLEWSRI
jgi:hypothetical protein